MKMDQGGVLVAAGAAKVTDVFGIRVDILLTGNDTNGQFSQYEMIVPPGAGAPPHVHEQDDETFFVIDGDFEFLCGDQVHRGSAGTSVFLPRHIPHTFRNVGDAAGRILATATPAGHEFFFEDIDDLTRRGAFTPDAAIAVCRRHKIELIPPTVTSPV